MRKLRVFGALMATALVAALLAAIALAHDNSSVTGSISPPDGSTITAPSTTLTVTFGGEAQGTGCGLNTNIKYEVSSGTISDVTTSCTDGLWTSTATWSGYSSGEQTVTVSFLQKHGQVNDPFTHEGSVTATYTVNLETTDCPAAPAVAARLLRDAGKNMNDEDVKNYIAQVAAHMGPETYFDGVDKCDLDGYEAAVEAFLEEIGALP